MKGTAAGLYRATMLLSIFVPSPASAPSAILDPALRVAGAPIAERNQPAKPRIGGPIGRIDEVRLKATNLWRGHPDDLAKPNSLRLEVEIKRNATSDWRASELIDIVKKAEKPEGS
jgi:hypothetical protein